MKTFSDIMITWMFTNLKLPIQYLRLIEMKNIVKIARRIKFSSLEASVESV